MCLCLTGEMAAEASRMVFAGDIWPHLLGREHWQGVRVFGNKEPRWVGGTLVSGGPAWNEEACALTPTTCRLLRGRAEES